MTTDRKPGDRGGGIHISAGSGLQIPAGALSIDLSSENPTGGLTAIELRVDTHPHWIAIAEEAAGQAADARRRAVDAPLGEDKPFGKAVEAEFRATLMAITAAVSAAEAFYGSVIARAPDAKIESESRSAAIFETFKRAFSLKHEQQEVVREPFRVMFNLRNEAVHPRAGWTEPALHPVFNLVMQPRFVNYRAENAIGSVDLVRKLIWICLQHPKAGRPKLKEWCDALKDVTPEPPDPPDWVVRDEAGP